MLVGKRTATMNEPWLLWSLLFGSIGLGYIAYGRRQKRLVPFLSGLALMAFPYFIDGAFFLVLTGLLLMGVPLVVKT
jgi:hypothetical protein